MVGKITRFLGVLSCLDGFMNIALEQTEEHVNGVITNKYGDAFIRGNNGAHIYNISGSRMLTLINTLNVFSQYYISRQMRRYE